MPRDAYTTCKSCGKHRDDCGTLSWTRLCLECGRERLNGNHVGMTTKSGPWFKHYRRRMVAAYGGVLLDDLPSSGNTPPDAA